MSMRDYSYIRKNYGVPAREGMRIKFEGRDGTILPENFHDARIVW